VHHGVLATLLGRKEQFIPITHCRPSVSTSSPAGGRRARSAKPSVRAHWV